MRFGNTRRAPSMTNAIKKKSSLPLLLGALSLNALVTGGCADMEPDEGVGDVGSTYAALTSFTPVAFSMPDSYYGTTSSGTTCSSSAKMDMAGFEPTEAGTYPV